MAQLAADRHDIGLLHQHDHPDAGAHGRQVNQLHHGLAWLCWLGMPHVCRLRLPSCRYPQGMTSLSLAAPAYMARWPGATAPEGVLLGSCLLSYLLHARLAILELVPS